MGCETYKISCAGKGEQLLMGKSVISKTVLKKVQNIMCKPGNFQKKEEVCVYCYHEQAILLHPGLTVEQVQSIRDSTLIEKRARVSCLKCFV